jgi:hypothetical protein
MPAKIENPVSLINEIGRALLKGETGGTLPISTLPVPTTGYLVGGARPAVVADSFETLSGQAVIELADTSPTLYVGWWIDSDDGRIYVDAVNWYSIEGAARAIGKIRGEIAIWDIANESEIRL